MENGEQYRRERERESFRVLDEEGKRGERQTERELWEVSLLVK